MPLKAVSYQDLHIYIYIYYISDLSILHCGFLLFYPLSSFVLEVRPWFNSYANIFTIENYHGSSVNVEWHFCLVAVRMKPFITEYFIPDRIKVWYTFDTQHLNSFTYFDKKSNKWRNMLGIISYVIELSFLENYIWVSKRIFPMFQMVAYASPRWFFFATSLFQKRLSKNLLLRKVSTLFNVRFTSQTLRRTFIWN